MLKKNIIVIIKILLLQLILTNFSYSKIQIKVLVNDEIITNIDIKKESEYLKILNPNLNQLEEKRIQELSKISLINEIVKKKEILKVIDITSNMNSFTNEYLENLYVKLDYKSKKEFENQLRLKNTYTLEEIKNKINIELFWNELIYKKYNNLVNINKNELVNKIEKTINKEQKEYNLSEIVFTKKKNLKLEDQINQIKLSINDIGFRNTANIFSISQSSKFGGDLGWVNENSLSKKIFENLFKLKEGELSEAIDIGNNYLILKVNKIRVSEIKINKEKELEKLIQIETNRQLNKYSRIFFDKSKINYLINEK